jgi:hypothetical protein
VNSTNFRVSSSNYTLYIRFEIVIGLAKLSRPLKQLAFKVTYIIFNYGANVRPSDHPEIYLSPR